MNEQFTQLMLSEPLCMTDDQRHFVETHKQIIICGEMAAKSLMELGRKLREMHNGKLYKAAGFKNFEEYSETAAGIGSRQAYRYIKVVEKFDEKYLAENSELGITKLNLLAEVTESERIEIEEKVDVKKASKREVEDAVKTAIRERDEKQKQIDELTEQLDAAEQEKDSAETARKELEEAYGKKKNDYLQLQGKVKELEVKKADLEKQLENAKAEVKTVPDEASKKEAEEQRARADGLDRQLKETLAELEATKVQKKAIASDELLTFKIKFDDIQRLWADLNNTVDTMKEDVAAKCKNALNAVLAQWVEAMKV